MQYTECLGRPRLTELKIEQPNEKIRERVQQNWDAVAKPLDGMGRFETIIDQIGAIQGSTQIDIAKKAVIIMCADNGVVAEGVSQSGQEVTFAVARSMAKQQSSVGQMAAAIGADTIPVDIGINSTEQVAGLLDKKVRPGTRNFTLEPAMTADETRRAIRVGIEMVHMCRKAGYGILATGEMGIGNTTTSAAMAAALLGCDVQSVTGRGAGLNDRGLAIKESVIRDALEKYELYQADAFTVLRTVGGLDIAGLAGVCIGGARYHIPIVLDGVISMVAALAAERMVPGVKAYMIASHSGKEPAVGPLTEALGLEPVIDGQLALGEGTGAVMMFALLDLAMSIYSDRTTFGDIKVTPYERYV